MAALSEMSALGETPVAGTRLDAAPPKSSRRRLSESGGEGGGGGGLDDGTSAGKKIKDRGKEGTYIVFLSTALSRQLVLKWGRGRRGGSGGGRDGETKGKEREKKKTERGSVPLAIAGPPLSGALLQLPRCGRLCCGVVDAVWTLALGTRSSCLCPALQNFSDSPTAREIMKNVVKIYRYDDLDARQIELRRGPRRRALEQAEGGPSWLACRLKLESPAQPLLHSEKHSSMMPESHARRNPSSRFPVPSPQLSDTHRIHRQTERT
jgi:hypothetical protein